MNPAGVVRETTEQREQAAKRPMTLSEAFEEAKWLRRMPEGILSPVVARQAIETLYAAIDANPVLRKALERGQEIFVLVQQDRAAPSAITQWADLAKTHGCPEEKVADAYKKAVRWLEKPDAGKKWPD